MVKLDPQKTIYLIDGSSILYRGYYGVRPLHTPQGEPVQAVYNFCRVIKKLIDRFSPQHVALVWDSPGKTVRHEMYEEYKAGRQAPPSDLFQQKERICQFADLIGLAQIAQEGYEADDLMYSLAREWVEKGGNAVFVTSDKDMGQAITDRIIMYDPAKDQVIDADVFEKKMGFAPPRLQLYFALLGDTSDNIPGVRGIGAKTAATLAQQFDSVEQLYELLGQIKPPRAQVALAANKENAFLSRDLFLLQYTPTDFTTEDAVFDASNWVNARPLFQELAFTSLLKDLGASVISFEQKCAAMVERGYDFRLVTTMEQLKELVAYLEEKGAFALDTETDGLRPLTSSLVGLSFCAEAGRAYYVPCGHVSQAEQLDRGTVLATLKPVLENKALKKYFHNAKFDELVIWNHGVTVQGTAFDTLLAASLTTKSWQRANLKALSVQYFEEHMLTYEDVVKRTKLPNFAYVDLELATLYSANDSHQTFRLVEPLKKELAQLGMEKLYETIEFPLVAVLFTMEREGIYLDVQQLVVLSQEVARALEQIQQEIDALLGSPEVKINLNSPKQLQRLLFEELKLPPQKKSAKGTGYSTDSQVLAVLAKLHPVPALILKYRELFKLKSTYLDALPEYVNPNDHRIHTTFSQTRTETGRLASLDPNLQNIPAADGYGVQIRAAFQPREGNVFVSADYSQIELRVLAYLSQDKHLRQAFLSGKDIHSQTASGLFNVPVDAVTHKERQIGKRINFSILYGLTPYGLSKDLDIAFKEAKLYIERYFEQYPGVLQWMDRVVAGAKENGYVTTLWGRRRDVPGIHEQNKVLYEEAKRVAINTVAQGTAAEIMKQGMVAVAHELEQRYPKAQLLLQIHDELLISVPAMHEEAVAQLVQHTLEKVVDWDVPLEVVVRAGRNWSEVSK